MARQIAVINKSKGWEAGPAKRILKYTVLTILLVASFVLVAHREAALADNDSPLAYADNDQCPGQHV